MAASYSPRVRHFELKFQSFADEGFPRDPSSAKDWNLSSKSLQSGVFSAFYGEQQKKNTFFCCQKGHSLRTDAFSPKKGGETISLLDFFLGRGGRLYTTHTTLLIHITHWKKKYTRTAKTGGLNGLRSAKKKRCEEFTGTEEGFN